MSEVKAQRLDTYLQLKYPAYSRSTIQKLIKLGNVTINGEVEKHPSKQLSGDEPVEISFDSLQIEIEEIEFDILYEDDNCVVIIKPVGILTHSKGVFNPEPTVASWLTKRQGYSFSSESDRAGIVHRLDRATSGVIICAKNKSTLGMLQKQFQLRKAKKTYMARVKGLPEPEHAILDLPIERNPKKPQTFRVASNGKEAQTEYEVIKKFDGNSLVALRPRSGRTHQLRVHMQYIKHPIYGDLLYSGSKADRLYLHAESLEITIPRGERKVFAAETPKTFYKDF